MDEDEAAYAMIARNVASARLIESRFPPEAAKQPIMSLENVIGQRVKIAEIAGRLRSRAAKWQEGPRGS